VRPLRRVPGGRNLRAPARRQAADIELADGQLNLARQALCLQAGETLGGVDDDIQFSRAESGSAKQDQGEAEVTKQHAAILPDSPLAWPSLAASFADCLAALAKNARQKLRQWCGTERAFKDRTLERMMANLEQHVSVYSQALNLRTQRHQVLASNIANADTPNYKARDFNFTTAMQNALSGRAQAGGIALATTSAGHISGGSGSGAAQLQFRKETQSAVDGNTVDMDVERAQITDNAMQYQILTQLIGDKFKGIRSALASTNSKVQS
jgi:flagellar basal-body rod protein FlgB